MLLAAVVVCGGCSFVGGDDTEAGPQLRVETTITEDGEVAIVPTTVPLPEVTAEEGVVVWAHDREPPDLHLDDPDNGAEITSWVRQGLLEGLFGIDADHNHIPELLAAEPVVTVNNSGTVSIAYELRAGLAWSDGTPLTANDVAYTHRILTEGCELESDGSPVDGSDSGCIYRSALRPGYDLVTSFQVTDETHFTIDFASFYPGWRGMYDQVFAAHAFGENADVVNASLERWEGPNGILPSSGPLVFAGWEPGVRMDLVANGQYHGSVNPGLTNPGAPSVAGVQILFVPDAATRIELVRNGSVDLLMSTLDPVLAPLTESAAVTVRATSSQDYELLGMNLLDPHLASINVREAIAYAVDKGELIAQVYQPLLGDTLPPEGLGNTYWLPGQPNYQDHQEPYAGHQVDAARAALEAGGYVQGADGIYEHPETGRLTIRAATTGGNPIREQQLELIVAQLADVGIEVTVENLAGGLFYEQGPFSPDSLAASASDGRDGNSDLWDLALFSWSTGPWPGGVSGAFRTGSNANPYGFTNGQFDVAATDCDGNSDDVARAECYNTLDTFVTTTGQGTDGLFVVPLTQRPHYLATGPRLTGIGQVTDSVLAGPLVTVADFALEPEPADEGQGSS